jgi:hypothetical protein
LSRARSVFCASSGRTIALGLLAETLKHLGEQVLRHAMHHLLDWIIFAPFRYTCVLCVCDKPRQVCWPPAGNEPFRWEASTHKNANNPININIRKSERALADS